MNEAAPVDPKRIVWLDILRVLSAFAIVFLHTSTNFLEHSLSYGSFNWFTADIYLAVSRYAVPVFVMISGVFFLNPDKEITIGNIYTKYIFRMLSVLLGWALIRTLIIDIFIKSVPSADWPMSFFVSIQMYWFLPMIIGLYIMTPVLRAMTVLKNRNLLKYFMVVTFILALCFPVLEVIELYFFPKAIALSQFTNLIKIPCLLFGTHYVFGYYAYTYDLSKTTKRVLYASAVISVLLLAAGSYFFFNQQTSRFFYFSMHGSSLTPFAFLIGASVFVFCKDNIGKIKFTPVLTGYIQKLAYYSLGVYLLHIIIVEIAARFNLFKTLGFLSLVMIPVVAVLIFAVSNAIICLLYKIKWFRRYFL